jgi:hypothetical protein
VTVAAVNKILESIESGLPQIKDQARVSTAPAVLLPPTIAVRTTDQPDPERVLDLRRRGMSVTRISQLLGADEMYIARLCGVPLWKGQVPHECKVRSP